MFEFPLTIQTYSTETNTFGTRLFEDKEQFKAFVWTQFKEPGSYNLKNISSWKLEYNRFNEKGYYTEYVKDTFQYKKYWKNEKDKVLTGIIVDDFYIPPFYYFYLNFLKIYNKVEKKHKSPDIYDSDYHFMLYIMLCILEGKHAVVVKTRQRGYSYKIMAILYWSFMWFEGSVNTIGASDEDFVIKTWKYLDQYRQHTHKSTAWKRGPNVPKSLDWTERTLTSEGDYVGLGSTLKGTTFKQSPSRGVGGAQSFFFYEEAGIAPTLLSTIEYIRPAIEAGVVTTGTIIVSGSVGELDDCDDLKRLFYNPDTYNFLPVKNVWDENPEDNYTGFFVPDSWSLFGFIDENGNSKIKEAEQFILNRRKKSKEGKSGEKYQLEISQNPLSPKEAFAFRKDSYFPQHIMASQIMRLESDKPKVTSVELFQKDDGTISFKTDITAVPITKFPLKESESKEGCIVIKEFPDANAPFLTYFAGVDPVSTDKTTTSESLFSVYIFKNLTETKYKDGDGQTKLKLTGFEPVAWYTGRYDDLKRTNQMGEYLIRYYNAFACIESNAQSFINHMQAKGLQRYMATKLDIPFIGDLNANKEVHKVYGVHMTPIIKNYILSNIKEYVSEETDFIRKEDGSIVKTVFGVERLKDLPLCEEIKQFHEKLNVDRIIAFGLALSMAKAYMMNGIVNRTSEIKEKEEELVRPTKSFFRTSSNFEIFGDREQPIIYRKSYFKHHA